MFYESLKAVPEGVHAGLYRNAAIEAFNSAELGLDLNSDSPLAAIVYRPARPVDDYVKQVSDAMCTYPWMEVYGLDYNQVMQLPYDEWSSLFKRLVNRKPDPVQKDLAASMALLTQVLMKFLGFKLSDTTTKDSS